MELTNPGLPQKYSKLLEGFSGPLGKRSGASSPEEDLGRLARIYETILSTTDDFAYIFDPKGRFLYANARLLEVWAKTLDEVIGKTCHDLGYPTWHADMHMREIEDIVHNKVQIRGEVPFTGDSGISGIYEYIFKPVLDSSGNVEVIVGTTRDVTHRKRDEEAMRAGEEARARIAAIVESSDDAIISKTLEGIITSWNQGAERIFGYASSETIGKSIYLLIPPELQKEEPMILDRLKKGERIEHYETVRLTKDGRKIDVSLTVSPIRDASGKIIGASKIARDITEAKQTFEERRQELERLVSERTSSLLEAITQMEEFSYSVSHDLRAPLRAMQGYATALLEDYGNKLDEEGQEYLQRIISAGVRMDRLTRDVLVYSKIPRSAIQLHPVDLDKLVADIVQQFRHGKSAGDHIVIETPLLPVVGSESLLTQAISNLVDNAVKFASKDRPLRVRIWTEAQQDHVTFSVEDNGIGILPEHQNRIWGMFERIHPQHMYEGTGIGLAIVRKTVERMNGTVGVVSDGTTGSKFWIQLPAVTSNPPQNS